MDALEVQDYENKTMEDKTRRTKHLDISQEPVCACVCVCVCVGGGVTPCL